MLPKALEGLRVLDWSQMVAGPYCAKLLADLGADTIKIELPERGDEARAKLPFYYPPHAGQARLSGLFLLLNTSKKGVTLNVEVPEGKELFQKLVAWADVLIEDNSPQKTSSMGLDYEHLKTINSKLIMASITPFGQTGPYRDFKSYPLNTFHSGGEGFMTPAGTAFPYRPPVKSANYMGEYEVGINTAGAILAALYWCEETGMGQHIDISKQEILLYLSAPEVQDFSQWGMITDRQTRNFNFGGQYPCKDGYIYVSLLSRAHRAAFFELVGYPDWQKNENLLSRRYLDEQGKEVEEVVKERIKERTKQDIWSSPKARECPVGPYLNMEEVVTSPQMQARGFFEEIEHPETGRITYPSAPYHFSGTPRRAELPAPSLGQHNTEVFRRLGYSPQQLQHLKKRGAI